MSRSGTHGIYYVCVALAIALVLAGWIWNLRSLFAQAAQERESGFWSHLFSSKAQTVAADVKRQTDEVREAARPLLEGFEETARRQQAYESAVDEMKETWPYVETGTQKTDTR